MTVRTILGAQERTGSETSRLHRTSTAFAGAVRRDVDKNLTAINEHATKIAVLPLVRFRSEKQVIATLQVNLTSLTQRALEVHQRELDASARHIAALDPISVLRRGFSITRYNGKAAKRATEVPPGAEIETTLFEGKLLSTVQAGCGENK
jgi:exonuclease VII large subunit